MRAELTAYFRETYDAFDVIVSADTLVYFGDLEGVLSAAADTLRLNGHLIFTLEHAVDHEPDVEYRLELHGRYSHGQAYVERLLAAAGLRAEIARGELRLEAGVPVPGL